tara:strand:+ start:402 stop:593 length:192 start_codon:yes stop_codon:yes gene_type:complete
MIANNFNTIYARNLMCYIITWILAVHFSKSRIKTFHLEGGLAAYSGLRKKWEHVCMGLPFGLK